jgi:hypothetical protein
MQTTALDRDDSEITVVCHNSSPDDTGDQDTFDLWLDLGGSD